MRTYLFVREITPNRSPEIDRFNLDAGVPVGSYWCEAFRFSSVNRAAKALRVKNPLLKTAAVWRQLQYAHRYGTNLKVIPMAGRYGSNKIEILKGDFGCIKHGGKSLTDPSAIGRSWNGHAITAIADAGDKIQDIEGNAAGPESRNGDRVKIAWRKKNTILAFIRIIQDEPLTI